MNTYKEAQIMSERDLQQEINRISGGMEVLGLLRESLQLQRDELGAESGQEAMDEMLNQVAALQLEYQRRRAELHPHHKSYLFFMTDADVLPILHDCYADLVSGKAISSEFAGQSLRLADWYVRMDDDRPQQVVNESYSWLILDEFGRADLHAAQAIKASPLPAKDERDEMNRRLFTPGRRR
jgi:hypothetical protein